MSSAKDNREPDIQLRLTDETIVEKKKARRCATFCDNFGEYSENTTIHGIKYLGEQQRSIAEKIWWVIGFIVCISCLSYFIYIIVDKWQKTPVILTTDDTKTPIYKVPFPAVTICPETKMKSQLFNFTETVHKLEMHSNLTEEQRATNESIRYFEAMSHVCDYEHFVSTDQSLWKGKQFMDKSYVRVIQELSPDYEELVIGCQWQDETDCNKILTPILTDEGQCYTFNIITEVFRDGALHDDYLYFESNRPKKHWNFDDGYTDGATKDAHPKRAMAMGVEHGLTILLNNYDDNINYLCRNADQGYKITLHNPTEFPQPSKNFIRVPLGQSAKIAVMPKIVKTASSLKSYSPKRRQCFFDHERHLKFFKTYNQKNCKLECVSNITYTKCGCVKFSVPRGRGVPICGPEKITCYAPIWNEYENDLLLKQFNEEYYGKNESDPMQAVDTCNCLPECTLVQYTNEQEIVNLNFKKVISEFDPDIGEGLKNIEREFSVTIIQIYFGDTKFYGETRSELYGISDLVSNFGGLLGLFMGGSLLSLVELLYFCTIRSLCNARRNRMDSDV